MSTCSGKSRAQLATDRPSSGSESGKKFEIPLARFHSTVFATFFRPKPLAGGDRPRVCRAGLPYTGSHRARNGGTTDIKL
jgi:hypothetical protein